MSCIILGSLSLLCGCKQEEPVPQIPVPDNDLCKITIKDQIEDKILSYGNFYSQIKDSDQDSYINIVKLDIDNADVVCELQEDGSLLLTVGIVDFQSIVDDLVLESSFRNELESAKLTDNVDALLIGYIKNKIPKYEKVQVVLECEYDGYEPKISLENLVDLFDWSLELPEDEVVKASEFYTMVDNQKVLIEIDDVSEDTSGFSYLPDAKVVKRVSYRVCNLGFDKVVLNDGLCYVANGEVIRRSEVIPGVITSVEVESCESVFMDVLVWSDTDGDIYWIDDTVVQRVD